MARTSRRSLAGPPAALLVLGLLATACGQSNKPADFPVSVGFTPLEPISDLATFPATTAQGLGPIAHTGNFDHYGSHVRGFIAAPLATVYQALHDPAASYIHNLNGQPNFADPAMTPNVEPFPISFRLHYLDPSEPIVGNVLFDVTYRGGVLEGTEAEPIAIGERYQKTWGTNYIRVMSGSLRATAADGAPDFTAVEMEAWLDATTQGQSNCDGTLTDLFDDLVGVVASLAP
jgi:hypothetical protein